MDKSNFDVIRCHEDGCEFWHIFLTEGFETVEQANKEIKKIIKGTSFYNKGRQT